MNTKQAKSIAFGSTPASSLVEYYNAWQYLKDNNIELQESDQHYLMKLVEDGNVLWAPQIEWLYQTIKRTQWTQASRQL